MPVGSIQALPHFMLWWGRVRECLFTHGQPQLGALSEEELWLGDPSKKQQKRYKRLTGSNTISNPLLVGSFFWFSWESVHDPFLPSLQANNNLRRLISMPTTTAHIHRHGRGFLFELRQTNSIIASFFLSLSFSHSIRRTPTANSSSTSWQSSACKSI